MNETSACFVFYPLVVSVLFEKHHTLSFALATRRILNLENKKKTTQNESALKTHHATNS